MIGFFLTISCLFPEGRLIQQADWGWAGNKGRMGRVGETTASSHQHRCRYRIIVVCYCRAFGKYDGRHAVPFQPWQRTRLRRKRTVKERGKGGERNVSEAGRQERQEISIGRKSKSEGGRGRDLNWGGREEFCGDHRLYILRDGTRYQRRSISDLIPWMYRSTRSVHSVSISATA